jgi:hypothetical protein
MPHQHDRQTQTPQHLKRHSVIFSRLPCLPTLPSSSSSVYIRTRIDGKHFDEMDGMGGCVDARRKSNDMTPPRPIPSLPYEVPYHFHPASSARRNQIPASHALTMPKPTLGSYVIDHTHQ